MQLVSVNTFVLGKVQETHLALEGTMAKLFSHITKMWSEILSSIYMSYTSKKLGEGCKYSTSMEITGSEKQETGMVVT